MGLITLALDTVFLSSCFAGVRRATGLSIKAIVVPMVPNNTLRNVTNGFFGMGEWVVDKSVELINRNDQSGVTKSNPAVKRLDEDKKKRDD